MACPIDAVTITYVSLPDIYHKMKVQLSYMETFTYSLQCVISVRYQLIMPWQLVGWFSAI